MLRYDAAESSIRESLFYNSKSSGSNFSEATDYTVFAAIFEFYVSQWQLLLYEDAEALDLDFATEGCHVKCRRYHVRVMA